MPDPIPITYGFPYRGFQDSKARHLVGRDKVTSDEYASSLDWQLDPNEGSLIRRRGLLNHVTQLSEAGITYDAAWPIIGFKFKGVKVGEFRSPTITGYVSWLTLLQDEERAATTCGFLAWYHPSSALVRTVADQGAWTGGVPPGNPNPTCIVWPHIGLTRMRNATQRAESAGEARNYGEVGDWVYVAPMGSWMPWRWNKQHPAGTATFNRERVQPWMVMPPPWMPRITLPVAFANGITDPGHSWQRQDKFFAAMSYVYDDDTIGPPTIPRPVTADLTAGAAINSCSPVDAGGYGLIQLGTVAGLALATDSVAATLWNDIPYPPWGVKGIALWRSPKVSSVTAGLPDPTDLRLVTIVPYGTTQYLDTKGNDAELAIDTRMSEPLTDPRRAHIATPRARYIGSFDQRIAVSYVRGTAASIIIQCKGLLNNGEFNTRDDTIYATREAYATITYPTLELLITAAVGTATHRRAYDLTGITLQQLVDRINSQRGAAADSNLDYRWYAQLVPGANGASPCTTLANQLNFGDRAWTTTAPAVIDGNATIAAGTNYDPMRCVASSWCGILLDAALSPLVPSTFPTQRDLHFFTRGGPDAAPNAAMAFCLGNNRRNPPGAGDAAGPILPLINGGLVPCTNAVCVIFNDSTDRSGSDDDYRIQVIDPERGVISPSCAVAAGLAVVLTAHGIYAYDSEFRGLCISNDLFNPSTGKGALAYEIGQCVAATGKDDSTGYFNVAMGEAKIYISYRSSVGVTRPDRFQVLDYSRGLKARGIDALIDPETNEPWGWSTPFKPRDTMPNEGDGAVSIAPSAMAVIRNYDGTVTWYGTRDRHGVGQRDSSMVIFDSGFQDNGVAIPPGFYQRTDSVFPQGAIKHKAKRCYIEYAKNGTGLSVAHARSADAHANAAYFRSKALASSGATLQRERYWWPIPTAGRQPTAVSEIRFTDDGTVNSEAGRPRVWGTILEVEPVDTGT